MFGANMGEVIRFVSSFERERNRLARKARAINDSIVPPADPMGEQQEKVPIVSSGDVRHSEGDLPS
jgi:hypothetical protein